MFWSKELPCIKTYDTSIRFTYFWDLPELLERKNISRYMSLVLNQKNVEGFNTNFFIKYFLTKKRLDSKYIMSKLLAKIIIRNDNFK